MNFSLPARALFLTSLLAVLCCGSLAEAQTPGLRSAAEPELGQTADIPEDLTRNQVDELVARLSDQEVRALLIRQLDRAAPEEPAPETRESLLQRLAASLAMAEVRLDAAIQSVALLPRIPGQVWQKITGDGYFSGWMILLKLLVFFAVGAAFEQWMRRSRLNLANQEASESLVFKGKLRASFLQAMVDVIAVLIFVAGAVIAWIILGLPTDPADILFTTLLAGIVILRLITAPFRLVLAPSAAWHRMVNLSDAKARSFYGGLLLVAGMLVFVMIAPRELLLDLGFGEAEQTIVAIVTSFAFILTLVALIWQLRPGPQGTTDSQDYMARNGHVLCIIGVVFFYLVALVVHFATGEAVLQKYITTLIALGAIPIVDIGMRGCVKRFMAPDEEDQPVPAVETGQPDGPDAINAETAGEATAGEASAPRVGSAMNTGGYEKVIVNNLRILLALSWVFVLTAIWDLNLFGFLEALVGERFARVLVNISITALLAYAVWGIISTAVARVAGPETDPAAALAHGGDGGGGGGTRLGTVLPLLKKFMFITLIVMIVMILLSSLGVDIGPLIAGAGIIGIAIGFGAQTLVRDIVSGLFFLLDDAFRVGEYVTMGDTKGTVEKISVRSLRLRHHNGPLHTVPFGEIQTLTNWSRDWAIMKFEIRVPFETDVDMVRRIIKKVGQQMLEDEELGPFFLAPLKSQGVNRMDDSSFIIRCKFTAIPGNQFYIRREAYMRIQRAFEEKGIKFAPRRVIVETTSPEVDVKTAAAAAGALDQPNAAQNQGKDEPG